MKKWLALLVAVAMLLMLLPAGVVSADMTEGDYRYTVTDEKATITDYTGPGGDVVIPDTLGGYPVVKVDDYGFYMLTSLTSIIIPNSVTSIGIWAFVECTGLITVTISNNVTQIGESAFGCCYGLTDVYYGGTPFDRNQIRFGWDNEYLKNATWHYTYPENPSDPSNFVYTIEDEKATITTYTGLGGDVVIPDTLGGYPVGKIDHPAFMFCTGLTSIIIPNSVTTIRYESFYGCTSLTTVTIPNSVTTIGDDAFGYCPGLTDVYYGGTTFDRKQIRIGWDNEYLTDATWHYTYPSDNPSDPSNFVYTVEDEKATINAYVGPGGDVVIPATLGGYPVVEIGTYYTEVTASGIEGAFGHCTALTSITIPDSVTTIGEYAFYNCTGLTFVVIPDSVTAIGEYAFTYCRGLTSIKISNRLTTIGDCVFSGCTSLTMVTIPDSVTSIGYEAFYNCTGLTSLTIPDSITSIGGFAFSDCTGLTSVTIPNSVTSIGGSAFSNCNSLTDVWYSGAKIDRALIVIGTANDPLANATWHYETIAENGHYYSGVCDADCDKCDEVRQVPHVYSDCCDRECNVCFAIRKAPHDYAYVCDDECDTCGFLRKVTHTYDHDYDVDCNVCGAVRTVQYEVYAFAGNSVSPEVSGLAFCYDMAADGLTVNSKYEVIYDEATVTSNSDVGALKLVKMGVIASNKDVELRLESVNDYTCIDIEAKYLMECKGDSVTFAVRIIDIPKSGYNTVVSVRPYCIYEDAEGNLIVEYGEVQTATYNDALTA